MEEYEEGMEMAPPSSEILTPEEIHAIRHHPLRKALQCRYDRNSKVTQPLLAKLECLHRRLVYPRASDAKIKRPHLPPGKHIDIDLRSLFRHEHFIFIYNVVATCSWMPLPNLSYLAQYAPNIEFTSSNRSAINIRVDKLTCRLFTTGVVVFTAGRTIEQTKFEAHQYRLLMSRIPVPILIFDRTNPDHRPHFEIRNLEPFSQMMDFKVVNLVARGLANPLPLDLIKIVNEIRDNDIGEASWSPEHFPGAKVCIKQSEAFPFNSPKVSTHLFDTGKNMIMGVDLEDMRLLQQFICKWVAPYIDMNLPLNPLKRYEYRKMRLLTYSSTQQQEHYGNEALKDANAPDVMADVSNAFLNLLNNNNQPGATPIPAAMQVSVQGQRVNEPLGITSLLDMPRLPPTSSAILGLFPTSTGMEYEHDEDEQRVEDELIEDFLDNIVINNLRGASGSGGFVGGRK